jgi:acetyl-CoA carboxylase biotin carboxyl carrier protein
VKELAAQSATVRALSSLLDKHGLTEITLDAGQVHVSLRREPMDGERHVAAPAFAPYTEAAPEAPAGEAIEAPFTGIFYRAPKPNEPPFVEVGDWVEQGQAVCLIEANKVFSELTTHLSGRVTSIVAENGALVQPAEPLLYVDPSAVIE